MSFTLFARKWGLVLAALITAFALIAGARSLSSDGGPQTARSSWSTAPQTTLASAQRSSWS